jgi:putative membrane protein insertion efficiency factor
MTTRLLLGAIRAYQFARAGRLPVCRFDPTCSQYAAEAIATHGPGRGVWLATRRLVRCHPWGGLGYDPVPPPGRAPQPALLPSVGAPAPRRAVAERP